MNCPKCNKWPNETWDQSYTAQLKEEGESLRAQLTAYREALNLQKEASALLKSSAEEFRDIAKQLIAAFERGRDMSGPIHRLKLVEARQEQSGAPPAPCAGSVGKPLPEQQGGNELCAPSSDETKGMQVGACVLIPASCHPHREAIRSGLCAQCFHSSKEGT